MTIHHSSRLAVGVAAFVGSALALPADDANHQVSPRYGGFGWGDGGDGSGFPYSTTSSTGTNGFPGLFGASLQSAVHYRTIHGILAAVAMVVLFPVGAVLMRVVPGRFAIWVHAVFQVLAYMLYIAGAGLGIYLVRSVHIPFAGSGTLLSNSAINYHPIIGLVVLATLFVQPVLGYVHHVMFKRLGGRRTVWSHLHLWNGRLSIVLGIVNGGLGLHLAHASRRAKIAYAVVAGVLGLLWVATAIVSETRRARATAVPVKYIAGGKGRQEQSSHNSPATSHPEMTTAGRAVSTPSTGSIHTAHVVVPPTRTRRGDGARSDKTRESRSSVSSDGSARR